MHNIIEKYKKGDMTKHKKETYIKEGKLVTKKFWLKNYNPITGFPSEKIVKIRKNKTL